jgi:hypothetical protein
MFTVLVTNFAYSVTGFRLTPWLCITKFVRVGCCCKIVKAL